MPRITAMRTHFNVVTGFESVGRLCEHVPSNSRAHHIRYRRIRVGRPIKARNDKARAKIARMAYMNCMLTPDLVDTILNMSSGQLGRWVKAAVRCAGMRKHRGLVWRRPASSVFRIRDNQR
jgi:hypothetical protein